MKETKELNKDLRVKDNGYIVPKVDTYELDGSYILKADLPGADKEGLDVYVEGDLLTIKAAVVLTSGKLIYQEASTADYFRTFKLGNGIDRSNISANIKDGVLSITLPKLEDLKPRNIQVTSN